MNTEELISFGRLIHSKARHDEIYRETRESPSEARLTCNSFFQDKKRALTEVRSTPNLFPEDAFDILNPLHCRQPRGTTVLLYYPLVSLKSTHAARRHNAGYPTRWDSRRRNLKEAQEDLVKMKRILPDPE